MYDQRIGRIPHDNLVLNIINLARFQGLIYSMGSKVCPKSGNADNDPRDDKQPTRNARERSFEQLDEPGAGRPSKRVLF